MQFSTLDIFCHIIDNFGDIGVVYRFAREFHKKNPSINLRVFVDDLEAFSTINHLIDKSKDFQIIDSISYLNLNSIKINFFKQHGIGEVIIEAFACEIPDFIMEYAYFNSKLLINLDYLSAEEWVQGYHLKESLLPKGSLKKFFFMPGFTSSTGGILLNSDFENRTEISKNESQIFLKELISSIDKNIKIDINSCIGTIFTYLRGFDSLMKSITNCDNEFTLLIFGEKSKKGMIHTLSNLGIQNCDDHFLRYKNVQIIMMPFLSQQEYDQLLYHTDFNIVRGEDSLARAILAGKPFVWNAYLQENKYQKVKVDALCREMQQYFDSIDDYYYYHDLMIKFNDVEKEDFRLNSIEQFEFFFKNLNKFEHYTRKMSYFLLNNCNLMDKLTAFISRFQIINN